MAVVQYNERISYEVFGDGYDIYDYGHPWITQREPYAKVILPDGTYEENAIEHCRQLSLPPAPPAPTDEEILRADVDYLALMTDIDLPSQQEEEE